MSNASERKSSEAETQGLQSFVGGEIGSSFSETLSLRCPLDIQRAMYNKMWHQTQEALSSLLDKESQKMMEPQRNQVFIFQMLATFYIKYVQIFRNLENVYDQIVHPQKRILIRKILDAVMGRILELKNEMVELELTEFHYFDDILQDLKLAPKYQVKPIPLEEAVKLIQIAERARQGRLRAMFMKQIYLQEYRAKQARLLGDKVADVSAAALRIQKTTPSIDTPIFFQIVTEVADGKMKKTAARYEVWRGFHQCKRTEREREKEMIFLGMNPPPLFNEVSAAMIQADRLSHLRNKVQIKHEEEYRDALVTIKDDLKLTEGPDIKENLQDQIRHWFIECRNLTGTFPDYPNEEEGGSALIFSNKTPQQQEEDEMWKMSPSVFLHTMEEGNSIYKGQWVYEDREDLWKNKDESWNFPQDYDPELIKEDKRKELESEIRVQKNKKKGRKGKKDKDLTVDRTIESLYKELVEEGLLIQALKVNLSDYIGEYSYLGTSLRQVSIEPMPSLLDVRQLITLYGILPLGSAAVHEKAPLVKSLLLAGPSGVGKKMLVHAICTETGANLFNLSAANITGKYPGKSGLQMMLHVVFKVARTLQPSVVWIGDTEKTFYKKVPHAERKLPVVPSPHPCFLDGVLRGHCSLLMEPCRLWTPMEPKRLKKQLPKMLKLLKPDDRILIVGTTKRPFDAELQPFCKAYQKIILVPRPDYASRYGKQIQNPCFWKSIVNGELYQPGTQGSEMGKKVLWKEIIQRHGGVITDTLSVSCLAKITDGFTQGHIVQVVKEVLTERRLRQQSHKPLTALEFVASLTSMNPVYQEEEDSFKDWYAKTPMGKKRALALTGGNKENEKDNGKKEKKGEKEKKKKTEEDFPSGAVDENPLANAGDTRRIPDPGRFR
ncbi:hypothetical protein MG293_002178 [Ovis ammon polii]|uniref:ATPase AAA-type core domain-containing protein n=1 Tax=Ovis ammon polii TaxID=230172 RepID=A0AAD4UNP4_OVIAM|nr:hypothetical protein MG293_002178 [Ovis ammon polii]